MLQFEAYTLDIVRNVLRAGDREIALRPKGFELLRYLVENADRLVTKEELFKAIWPNVAVTDESLTHCVSEVRQAIGDSEQAIIKTVPRRGYRFSAPVVRVATGAAAGAPSPLLGEGGGGGSGAFGTAAPHGSTPTPNPSPAETAYTRVSATQLSDRNRQQPISIGGGEQARTADRPSVAVLPFANLSGDPQQDYFSD